MPTATSAPTPLRLTYSQTGVRHAADSDGVYPFSVSGYRIRFVGTARGRVLVLALFEPSAPDPHGQAVRPLPADPFEAGDGHDGEAGSRADVPRRRARTATHRPRR